MGNLGHGSGTTQLDVYNSVVLHLAPLQYPAGHSLPTCPGALVYTNLRTYDESVRMLQLIWAAVGQDNTTAAGCTEFCTAVRALLVRADAFALGSQERACRTRSWRRWRSWRWLG
ncbi:hypothetical protein AB1Y20_012751 [Prymnesium parvum]|uniref:Uncharacterized protein n=1 Tax=Prymnesium parvum TaxID=97485 RepID=A0AB34IK93_PRYPA